MWMKFDILELTEEINQRISNNKDQQGQNELETKLDQVRVLKTWMRKRTLNWQFKSKFLHILANNKSTSFSLFSHWNESIKKCQRRVYVASLDKTTI